MTKVPLNTIITGDCLKVMPKIGDESVNLVVTSPPYPGQRNDTRSVCEWMVWFDDVAKSIYRVLTDNGILVLNVMFKRTNGFFDTGIFIDLPELLHRNGFNMLDVYMYIKKNPVVNGPLGYCDHPGWEPVFVATKANDVTSIQFSPVRKEYSPKSISKNGELFTRSKGKFPNEDGARQPNVLMISPNGYSKSSRPKADGTSYPIELPDRFIRQYTLPGDVVLDPFAGAGTTCRAAYILGCNYIGIELLDYEAEKAREWLQRPFQLELL